jgi:DNA-binding MarR family transcriptional regulator
MPRTASPLNAHLGYWLRFVSNHVSQSFARKVEAHGVTVAEWVLLRQLLDHDALAPSRAAELMGMTRGAISKLAERLVDKRLINRSHDPHDGRAQRLALSAAGRALVPRLAALADANDAEFFAHLSADDQASLRRILEAVVAERGLTAPPVD